MTDPVSHVCDAITARLRETLPPMLDELCDAALRKMRSDLERELAGHTRAVVAGRVIEVVKDTKTELFELTDLACGIEGVLGKVAAATSELADKTDEIASRAADTEYALRKAGSWAIHLDERLGGRLRR